MGDQCLEGSLCASRKTSARWPKVRLLCRLDDLGAQLMGAEHANPPVFEATASSGPAAMPIPTEQIGTRPKLAAEPPPQGAHSAVVAPPRCSAKAVVQLRWPPSMAPQSLGERWSQTVCRWWQRGAGARAGRKPRRPGAGPLPRRRLTAACPEELSSWLLGAEGSRSVSGPGPVGTGPQASAAARGRDRGGAGRRLGAGPGRGGVRCGPARGRRSTPGGGPRRGPSVARPPRGTRPRSAPRSRTARRPLRRSSPPDRTTRGWSARSPPRRPGRRTAAGWACPDLERPRSTADCRDQPRR